VKLLTGDTGYVWLPWYFCVGKRPSCCCSLAAAGWRGACKPATLTLKETASQQF